MKYLVILTVFFIVFQCKKTPGTAFEKVRQASCSGNYSSFIKLINRDKLKFNYYKYLIQKGEEKDPEILEKKYKDYMKILKDDVKRGTESSLCNIIKYEKNRVSKDLYIIKAESKDLKSFDLVFVKFGNSWFLTTLPFP